MQFQENQIFSSHYRLLKLLGRGGFSEVWLANDQIAGVDVALKIYAPNGGLDTEGMEIFKNEFSLVFNMNHTNLLRPMHFDIEDNLPYLVMPYLSNGSVNSKINNMPEEEIWRFIHDVASGLSYLHKQDPVVIHQDIKPDNVLIAGDGTYMITDFGISTRARSTLRKSTRANTNAGTQAYMGPERFGKQPLPTKASDIWSLGAMVFEVMEGYAPFGEFGGINQKSGAEIPDMKDKYSENLKKLVVACLDADPEKRPKAETVEKYADAVMKGEKTSLGGKIGNRNGKVLLLFLIALIAAVAIGYFLNGKGEPDDKTNTVEKAPTEYNPEIKTFTVGNVSFNMVKVEGSTFVLGASNTMDSDICNDELPAVNKTLSNYYLGECEVTQKLWKTVMNSNPSTVDDDDRPVNNVNWEDCQLFIQRLNQKTGYNFRLPTEAEWEYAAKYDPKTKKYTKYSGGDNPDAYAWYSGNSNNTIHRVKMKNKNALGIYDMSGNVIEWCQDIYTKYSDGSLILNKDERVLRGGCYAGNMNSIRSICRGSCKSNERTDYLKYFGLRLCLQ